MPVINVKVQNKIAQAEKNAYIVCGNSDYIINFELGEEWSGHNFKTALFVYNGKLQPVVFEGNSCAVPVLYNTTLVAVGLQSKDKTLITTTPSYIRCEISAEDLGGEIEAPTQDVYDEIIALLNKYIAEGGGSSSGGLTEEQVKQIVSEEISDLQTKTDERLETENKSVVGSINELNKKNNFLSQDIAVVNAILEQSGIVSKYKPTLKDTYSERVTADGANVLDGSLAKLEKVVGSTVACRNLIPYPYLFTEKTDRGLTFTVNADGSINVSGTSTSGGRVIISNTFKLSAGTYFHKGREGTEQYYTYIGKLDGTILGVNKAFTLTEETEVVLGYYVNANLTIDNTYYPMLNEGTTELPYQPYFTGLKSASFGGIESTNADGTETATLNFPKTETPLGTTIDFENNKITKEYAYLEQSTPFTEEQLANYTDYIISQDGKSIMYKLETPIVTDFTAQQSAVGNEYTAYKSGTERVLDNDGKEYGAENTLSQNYIIVTEVK